MNPRSLSTRFLRHTTFALALGTLGAAFISGPVSAAAPMVKTQAPGFYRTMLGDFEITVISDGTLDLPVDKLLSEPAAQTNATLKKSFLGSPLEVSVNAFLVNTGSRLVLVDTGAGTLLGPTSGKLVANLRAAGYLPEQVDDILLTHMHPDHEGGLIANGQRVFPNAVVHADKHEAAYWLSKANMDKAPADSKGFFQGAMASVQPYVDAGKFQPFNGDTDIVPGVRSIANPGHTPGHTTYLVESKGHDLLLIGDSIHVGSVQFNNPSVTIAFDTNAKDAANSRAKVFTIADHDGALVGAAHLSFPGLGHLTAEGKAWRWIPANYTTHLP
ncbi:MBL fold metallo-hydrolase [Dyella lipolytica]|uniref:MBL fold metallo-hydrolase n=1 Tax=Dyella lipolytica TaxID=1867835 RepID=A0ABW8J0E1_9GAMM|nr:MBL fold metallo-hydrolase [Dyella lipolytica]